MSTTLGSFLTEIADAIRAKKGTSEPINAQDFATEISNIQTGSEENRLKKLLDTTKSSYHLFFEYTGTSVDDLIKYSDTENVTTVVNMFANCKSLTTIPLLDTRNVTDMHYMFQGCSNLTTAPLLDTSNVTDMYRIFQSCYRLTKVIIYNSTKVPPLDSYAFEQCYHFYGTVNSTYNPEGLKDGRIYVPDDMVEAFRTATNWSVFADQILPLSELPEEE